MSFIAYTSMYTDQQRITTYIYVGGGDTGSGGMDDLPKKSLEKRRVVCMNAPYYQQRIC